MIQTPLLFANCPSRRRAITFAHNGSYGNVNGSVATVARSDYAINTGDMLWDEFCSAPAISQGDGWTNCAPGGAGSCSSCWRNPVDSDGISFQRSEVKASQVLDGMNQTILIGEKYLDPDNYFTGADPSDNENLYVGYDNDLYRTAYYDRSQPDSPSNGRPPMQDTPGVQDTMRFGSVHVNTCNFVFCDGSVRSILYFVDPRVFANLCSRNDQIPIDEKTY
jgi:prepilin-type processing-associated H-X9-DG protein